MKQFFYLLLVAFMMFPSSINAEHYKVKNPTDNGQPTPRTTAYVSVDLNETTGLMTLYFNGNVSSVEMTISQNGTVIDYDVIAGGNGGTATYSFSSYAVGEYLLTLETGSGAITQYIITVEDD